jgi:uncharacterized protein
MQPRIMIITLGVQALQRSLNFYQTGLGWQPSTASNETIAFLPMDNGIVLALYPWTLLAADATVPESGNGFRGITLAHNVSSREEVDQTLETVISAGGTLVKPAQMVEWGGYSSYFSDPDGHLWEVAWNPFFPIADTGNLVLP